VRWQKLKAQKMSETQKIIESTNVEVSTSVLPFAKRVLAVVFLSNFKLTK